MEREEIRNLHLMKHASCLENVQIGNGEKLIRVHMVKM